MKAGKRRSVTPVFDHIAVATREPETFKRVLVLIGLHPAGDELVASQGIRTHFVKPAAASEASIEVLEVVDPAGTVARYLEKRGAGIHHVCFRVKKLDELCAKLRAEKIRLVYEKPAAGAHGARVNFIHPDSTGGILVEISEKSL